RGRHCTCARRSARRRSGDSGWEGSRDLPDSARQNDSIRRPGGGPRSAPRLWVSVADGTMTLDLQQVARAMAADGEPAARPVTGWSVDTRTQQAGDVYFALRGEKRDGHDFVPQALEQGAAAVVVEAARGVSADGKTLRVADTLTALGELASWARQQWGGAVIGVTGSAGKTTTKDAIAHLLE